MNTPAQDASIRRRAPTLDVAVVGGGMGGAAAALALARAGFSTALLEARAPTAWSAEAEVDLRVVGLAPSSLALLDELGVWTSIRDARSSPYTHMHVWDAQSGAAIDFDAASEGRDRLGYIVENNLVQWTLWRALEAAGVRRLCPAEGKGFEARDDRSAVNAAGGLADGCEHPAVADRLDCRRHSVNAANEDLRTIMRLHDVVGSERHVIIVEEGRIDLRVFGEVGLP